MVFLEARSQTRCSSGFHRIVDKSPQSRCSDQAGCDVYNGHTEHLTPDLSGALDTMRLAAGCRPADIGTQRKSRELLRRSWSSSEASSSRSQTT